MMLAMASWQTFVDDAPDLAAAVEARLVAHKHHVLATLRVDGSPRVSGTEVQLHDGELLAGMMPGSAKAADVRRDGRCALHTNPGDGSMEGGDAKLDAVAVEVHDPALFAHYADESGAIPSFPLFRFDLVRVVRTTVHPDGDRLVIETWHPGSGMTVVERA